MVSRRFSDLQSGNFPQDSDVIGIERTDGVSYKLTFGQLAMFAAQRAAMLVADADGSSEDASVIPGPAGAAGAAGIAGRDAPIIYLEADPAEEVLPIPGATGATGAAGTNGTIGRDGNTIFLEPDAPEEPRMIPGPAGASGAAGTSGTNGRDGITVWLEPDVPEDPQVIPGPQGPQGTSGSGGGLTYTAFTQNLGAGDRSGTFDITGLSSLTADKVVSVVQTMAQVASRGNARDEFEMDPIILTGYVLNTTTIRCLWSMVNDKSVAVGTYAFAYCVSG